MKYFPASVRNTKELKFMKLQQRTMIIAGYMTKFEELCNFSMIYQRNPDDNWKCVKLEGGLREGHLVSVGPMKIRD